MKYSDSYQSKVNDALMGDVRAWGNEILRTSKARKTNRGRMTKAKEKRFSRLAKYTLRAK